MSDIFSEANNPAEHVARSGRRPRYDPPLINLDLGASPNQHRHFRDAYSAAWDLMCDQGDWAIWYAPIADRWQTPGEYRDLIFKPRKRIGFYRNKDGYTLYVPIDLAVNAEDPVKFYISIIWEFFSRYAAATHIDPPPAIELSV